MILNHPYWLVKVYNKSSKQWKNHLGSNVDSFVFSNAFFGTETPPLLYGINGLKDGKNYYNVGLSVESFSRQLSGSIFNNSVEDIPSFSFSFSRQWNNRYATVQTNDWIELIKSAASQFSLDGAGIMVWICNGAVPGFIFSAPNTWTEIAGDQVVTWTPPNYSLADSSKLLFHGKISKSIRDARRWKIECESNLSSTDLKIGTVVAKGENSSSDIIPIPMGVMEYGQGTSAPVLVEDFAAGFPVGNLNERTGLIKVGPSEIPLVAGAVDRIFWRDENTGRPVYIDSGIISHSDGSVSFSEEIAGATTTASRNATGIWNLSQTEIDNLFGDDYSVKRSQVTFADKREVVGLHSRSVNGACGLPLVTSETITFANNTRLESRGWGPSPLDAHDSGIDYNTDSSKGSIRVNCNTILPVTDFVEVGANIVGEDTDDVRYRGASGDIWDLVVQSSRDVVGTEWDVDTSSDGYIRYTGRNYGPGLWDGEPTFFFTDLLSIVFKSVIRTQKPQFDQGSDQLISVSVIFSIRIKINLPKSGCYGEFKLIKDPTRDPTETAVFSADNIITSDLILNASEVNIFDNTVVFDEIFDENKAALQVRIRSFWEENLPDSVDYSHAEVQIHRLGMRYRFSTDIRAKKLLWHGHGIPTTIGGSYSKSAHVNIRSIVSHYTDISVNFESASLASLSNHTGCLVRQMTLRDACKEICGDHNIIMRYDAETINLTDCQRLSEFRTVLDDDLMIDKDGFLELSGNDSDISDLYSGITVSFREYAESGDFASVIAIYPTGWKEFDNSYIVDTYDANKWEFIGSNTLINMRQLANIANSFLGGTDLFPRVIDYKCRHIRDREAAEKFLLRAGLFNMQRRKIIEFKGKLESWVDSLVGDQIEFALSSQWMDSFLLNEATPRRFVITALELSGEGSDSIVSVRAEELPYIPEIPYL